MFIPDAIMCALTALDVMQCEPLFVFSDDVIAVSKPRLVLFSREGDCDSGEHADDVVVPVAATEYAD